MDVLLTPELDQFIASEISSGRYASASEVVREALHLLAAQDEASTRQRAAFNQELEARLSALDRGEFVEPEAVFARLRQRSRERQQAHG